MESPKNKFNEKGIEEFPKPTVIFGNFMMISWIGVGAAACYLFYPLAAWIYIAFAFVMVYVILRKLVCMNCYYYGKRCALGWGKLSALLFKKGHVEDFADAAGLKLAAPTYGLLTLVPLVLVIVSIVKSFSIGKIAMAALLLLISVYSGFISRKKTCGECKMKFICPGSAAKGVAQK